MLLLTAVLCLAVAALPEAAGSVPAPVEAVTESGVSCGYDYGYGTSACHRWTNPQQTINAGESVKFGNPSTVEPYHGLKFTEGPNGAPSVSSICSGISAGVEGAGGLPDWHGECAFNKPGVYTFICTVHPSEMKGTITVLGTPTDATTAANGESQIEATLNGSIDPEGNTVEYHFEYGATSVSEHSTTPVTLNATDFTSHSVSAQAIGLQPDTPYHFLLVAVYRGGQTPISGAAEQTFNTLAVTAPQINQLAAEAKETEATLKGIVDPSGEATEYTFEYGTSTSYGQSSETSSLLAAGGSQPVSASLTKLAPDTEYQYRLVAKNGHGSGEGLGSFTTASSPPTKVTPPSPPSTTTTPSPTPTPGPISPEPALPAAIALIEGSPKLAALAHDSSVQGSLEVSHAGAGGRLEIDLLAKLPSSAKPKRKSHLEQVGRLVRASVSSGKVSFSIALNARARAALRRQRHLLLTVRIQLTPAHGATVTLTRAFTLRA